LLPASAAVYVEIMQRRVTAFVVVILATFLVLVWTGWLSWDAADQIASRLSVEQMKGIRVGDTFGADIHELRSHFRRYEASRDEAHWKRFMADARQIESAVHQQRLAALPPERRALGSLQTNLVAYIAASEAAYERLKSGASRDELGKALEALGDLASEIASDLRRIVELRQERLSESLAAARARFSRLVTIAAVTFWLAAGLATTLAVMVWRGLVQTLRRRLVASEDIARRNERLASLGILAAGLAHEVRNPLTAIKARLFIQQRRLPADSPAMEDARTIDGEINRLEGIVKTVLAFARPSTPAPVEVDPAKVLRQVQQLVQEECARQDIRMELDCPNPMLIRADVAQVHQVILNLVRNAMEAVGRGGHIQLRTRQATRRFHDASMPSALLEVEDDGPGIPPGDQERLFDPFFTTKSQGTGLGLAISARIVEGNGGLLEFASTAGRGTVFCVAFPCVT